MGGDEVTEVGGASTIQDFLGQKGDFEMNLVVDWEPVELGKCRGDMD